MSGRFRLVMFVAIVVASANSKEVSTIAKQQINRISPNAVAMKPTIDTSMLFNGQRLGRFEVTSVFGRRKSPGGIGSTYHEGVDVGRMPIGTPIFMPLNGTIDCRGEREGNPAGNYALIRPDGMEQEFLAAHLSRCSGDGRYQKGEVIALSGNSGASTAPHLHWGQRAKGGKYRPPEKGYLELGLGMVR